LPILASHEVQRNEDDGASAFGAKIVEACMARIPQACMGTREHIRHFSLRRGLRAARSRGVETSARSNRSAAYPQRPRRRTSVMKSTRSAQEHVKAIKARHPARPSPVTARTIPTLPAANVAIIGSRRTQRADRQVPVSGARALRSETLGEHCRRVRRRGARCAPLASLSRHAFDQVVQRGGDREADGACGCNGHTGALRGRRARASADVMAG
jgi:hypothetical protein